MVNVASKTHKYYYVVLNLFWRVYLFRTFSTGLFSDSFLLFSELDLLLLLLLLLLEDEELEEDFESCLVKLSFDTDPLDTSIS